MPNWCYNHIESEASSDAIEKLLQKAKAPASPAHQEVSEFSFLPFVEHLTSNSEEELPPSNNEIIGSKWFPEISMYNATSDSLTLGFDSAWAPTAVATEHMAQWLRENTQGEFSIVHSYEEAGVAFCGVLTVSRDSSQEEEVDILELYLDDPILESEEEMIEFSNEINVSLKQLREWIAQGDSEGYIQLHSGVLRKSQKR